MNLYGTLNDLKSQMVITTTADDSKMLQALEDASRALDRMCLRRHFYPLRAVYIFGYKDPYCLRFPDKDLLSVTSLTTNEGGTTISSDDYFLAAGESYNEQPYHRIEIDRSGIGTFTYSSNKGRANAITGVWGYHEDYANAWVASGATVGETYSSSDTTLTVSSGAAFKIGQTIQIESEWLYISAISTNDLTVRRGINGTTAAGHASGTAISIFDPLQDVQRVTLRFAAWLYRQYEAPFTFTFQTDANGRVIIPQEVPPEIKKFVDRYRRKLL